MINTKYHQVNLKKIIPDIINIAQILNINIHKGTYTFTSGPSYETSEEIKDIYSTLLEILSKKDSLSTKVINLSTCVSSYSNDQFKIYISIIKFILITILKIKVGYNFSNVFRSNILHSLEKLSSTFDNLICFEILEYINNNENDLFTYNLDKKIFNLNIFAPLNKIT